MGESAALTDTALIERRVRRRRRILRESAIGLLFLLPWLIGLVAFYLGPILASLFLSFTNYDLIQAPVLVGISNYRRLLTDPIFWQSLKVTAIYAVVATPLQLILSFLLALLMNQNIRLRGLWRTIFYVPNLVPAIATAMLWLWVLDPSFGLMNAMLHSIGIKGPLWLESEVWALPSIILMSLWAGVGAPMLIYLAGLQGISSELYEAVDCDGGGTFAKFWHITVPMMTPVIFFNLIVNMIAAVQIFTGPYLLTQGGPANATLFYVLNIYDQGFQYFQMGYASALAWILFVIILLMTIVIFRWGDTWVYYESGGGIDVN